MSKRKLKDRKHNTHKALGNPPRIFVPCGGVSFDFTCPHCGNTMHVWSVQEAANFCIFNCNHVV
jgi:hypothetical protein